MCCIFTCCGWMIDLIQRLWTFTMSCCISSAVCCSLVTASMSGVALGYNYSLAEYIDLKETNVSVYLKRGVFDDDIADDMNWRRSGHLPVGGHIGENNLMTGDADESTTLRSGRRLDDSIYESNDRNNFEGSLMRLTAKPPEPSRTTEVSSNIPIKEIIQQFPSNSLDQLKAVQSEINIRKAAAAAHRSTKKNQEEPSSFNPNDSYMGPGGGRRAMPFDLPPFEGPPPLPNSLRYATPDDRINDPFKWMLPKLPPRSYEGQGAYGDNVIYSMKFTYPTPVTPRAGPVRPTRPKTPARQRPTTTINTKSTPTRSAEPTLPKSIDEEMESFKEKLAIEKFDAPSIREDDFLKKIETGPRKPEEDYDEDIKGVPLRKKRSVRYRMTAKNYDLRNKNEMRKVESTTNTVKNSKLLTVMKKHICSTNEKNPAPNEKSLKYTNVEEFSSDITISTLLNLGKVSKGPPIVKFLLYSKML